MYVNKHINKIILSLYLSTVSTLTNVGLRSSCYADSASKPEKPRVRKVRQNQSNLGLQRKCIKTRKISFNKLLKAKS